MVPRALRRIALAVALALAVTVFPVLTLPASAARPVAPTVHRVAISGVDGATVAQTDRLLSTRRPLALTAPRDTDRFDLVALSWSGKSPADASYLVRVRENDQWGEWYRLTVSDDHGPDATTPEGRRAAASAVKVTEPLLTEGATGVQVRMDGTGAAPRDLTAVLVDAGRSAADVPSARGTARAATPQPSIITRAQWGADESLAHGDHTINSSVRTLFVHHTETTNSYTQAGAAAQVRAVYAFHTKVRGWDDVGYNFLVDRYGRIYEGRKGSITQAVQGAHTGGFNAEAIGVSVLGSFTSIDPPAVAKSALANLLAWKASQHFINPLGWVKVVPTEHSGSRYPAGKAITIRAINGHRDVGHTACPGNSFYNDLPGVRTAVAARMKPGVVNPSLSASSVSWNSSTPVVIKAAMATNQRWSVVITPQCSDDPVYVGTGRGTAPIDLTWNLTDAAGSPVPPGLYRARLTVVSPVGSARWDRDIEVNPTLSVGAGQCRARRLSTGDAITTAVMAAKENYPNAPSAVLASVGAPLDALLAAPLAGAVGGPLLFSSSASAPQAVLDHLARQRVSTVYMVGSTAALSADVEAQLRGTGAQVVRISGATRYDTAAAIARRIGSAPAALVASGVSLPDIAAAAGPAAAMRRPLLLVAPTSVPASTANALRDLGIRNALVVGPASRVSDDAMNQLGAAGVSTRARVGAEDAAVTAAAVATAYRGPVSPTRVSVVATTDLPHAALGAAQGRLVLFTGGGAAPAATTNWIAAQRIKRADLFASTRRVGSSALRQLYAATG